MYILMNQDSLWLKNNTKSHHTLTKDITVVSMFITRGRDFQQFFPFVLIKRKIGLSKPFINQSKQELFVYDLINTIVDLFFNENGFIRGTIVCLLRTYLGDINITQHSYT